MNQRDWKSWRFGQSRVDVCDEEEHCSGRSIRWSHGLWW